jgi:hypothetical protein
LTGEESGVIDLSSLAGISEVLIKKAQSLKTAVKKKGNSDNATMINPVLIRLSRTLLPVAYTYWGIYEQDLYGAEYLSKPLPGLYWVSKLAKLPKDSEKFFLYTTRLVRERNKIYDSFKEAIWFIDNLLKKKL